MKIIRWEYLCKSYTAKSEISSAEILSDRLNKLGEDGWELVGMLDVAFPPKKVIIFKRPVGYQQVVR